MKLALEYKQQLNKRIELFETKCLPLFLSLFHTLDEIGCGQGRYTKRFLILGGYPARFATPNVGSYNAWIKRLAKGEIRKKRMTSFEVSNPKS